MPAQLQGRGKHAKADVAHKAPAGGLVRRVAQAVPLEGEGCGEGGPTLLARMLPLRPLAPLSPAGPHRVAPHVRLEVRRTLKPLVTQVAPANDEQDFTTGPFVALIQDR